MTETLLSAASASGLGVLDRITLPRRAAAFAPAPEALHPGAAAALSDPLYAHQAEALTFACAGQDVCLATPTASGKTHVFMARAADLLLRDPSARILALYPARALILDQLAKWEAFLRPLGYSVGRIDGGIPTEQRARILQRSHVVVMTPDVAHAWLLASARSGVCREFLAELALLVLDEAHTYDGVFGTNMAFFLRRLAVAAPDLQTIASTATIGDPRAALEQLTGRAFQVIGPTSDGSPVPERTILVAGEPQDGFDAKVRLLRTLASSSSGRFLMFGDSRRSVELLVAAANEGGAGDRGERPILPYRAGYEEEDREEIQRALSNGGLAGVVSTSALEIGIDIGEIDVVVLSNLPPSMKAFWQRIGRGGRRRPSACLIIDELGQVAEAGGLEAWLARPIEPSWLYVENRYIQYAHALCAAMEAHDLALEAPQPAMRTRPYDSLPATFRRLLANELDPSEPIAEDLYPLKQRALAGPHLEFPLRSGLDRSFQVIGSGSERLGRLTHSQMLREGYPGAIYYYLGRPHRVCILKYASGEICTRRARGGITAPIRQAMVFPRFSGGVLHLLSGPSGFIAEVEMQVSERVLGYRERRGKAWEEHLYGPQPGAAYPRYLSRFIETTGVCWWFGGHGLASEAVADLLLETYSNTFDVETRDVGVGAFHARSSPAGPHTIEGMCIFDAAYGSLRLTQRLAERFVEVVDRAVAIARATSPSLVPTLERLSSEAAELQVGEVHGEARSAPGQDVVEVIAAGEKAVHTDQGEVREVRVLGHRFTPHGLMAELEPCVPGSRHFVRADSLRPLHGVTRKADLDLSTGDETPHERPAA